MGAYQQIEIGKPQGLGGMAEFLQSVRQEQRQRQLDAFNQMTQQGVAERAQQELELRRQEAAQRAEEHRQEQERAQQDRLAGIHKELQGLHDAGLGHEAQQLAGIYGLTATQGEQVSGPRVGQLYDNKGLGDFARQLQQTPGETHLADQAPAAATVGATLEPGFEGPQEAPAAAQPQTEADPVGHALAQMTSTPTFHYQGAGGGFDIVPGEREAAARAQGQKRAEMLRAQFSTSPSLANYADEAAARVAAGEDPKAVFADIRAIQLQGAKDAQKQKHDEQYSLTFDQRKQLAEIQARAAASRAAQGNEFKADTGNRQDMGALRQSFAEWKKTVQLPVDARSMKRLNTISENLNSKNALQQKEGAESLVSVFRGGGQVTKASQDYLLNHLSGIVGDAQTWLEHRVSGGFGPRDLAVLRQAANAALREQREKSDAYYQSAQDTFGPGSGWENLGGNVNHLVKGALSQFGYDAPDIYEGTGAAVTLGSGQRQGHAQAAPHAAKPGETKTLPDGRRVRKVGPNKWELVQ